MTYSDKVKASAEIYNYIQGMGKIVEAKEIFVFNYRGSEFFFECWNYKAGAENILSVCKKDDVLSIKSMNVDKVTKTAIHLYAFDMFNQRTTYKLPIYEMEMV